MEDEKTVHIGAEVPKSLRDALDERARQQMTNRSSIIRQACFLLLFKQEEAQNAIHSG